MGGMQRTGVLLAVLLISACTSTAPPTASPTLPAPGMPSAPASPESLAAAEPPPPTLREFRRQADLACEAAAATIAKAPLRRDPLAAQARPRDVRAAVGYFRAASAAWTTAAGQLWEFGLPERRAGEKLITSLDTVGQYSKQAADFLQQGDLASAQAAVGAVDTALRDANRIALALGLTRLEDCGKPLLIVRNPTKHVVTATDFAFAVGAVTPGATRFVVSNDGREDHQLFVVRLRAAGTLTEAVREDRAGGRPSAYLAGEGAVSPVVRPGQRSRLDVKLRPGPYGLVCFVASPDGTPHAYKGMATEIFVSR